MEALIDSRYLPITFSAGFLEADVSLVAAESQKWARRLGWVVRMTNFVEGSLETLSSLFPLTMPIITRTLFLMTRSSWTACFNNSEAGADVVSLISYLSQTIGCRGVLVTCIPRKFTLDIVGARSRPRSYCEGVQFTLYDPAIAQFPNCARAISLINHDGKWEFDTVGSPLAFEATDVYQAKEIGARFSPSLLEDYCRHLGIAIFDRDFFRGKAVMEQIEVQKVIDEKTIRSLFSPKNKGWRLS